MDRQEKFWTSVVDVSRTPSPSPPPKRMRVLEDVSQHRRFQRQPISSGTFPAEPQPFHSNSSSAFAGYGNALSVRRLAPPSGALLRHKSRPVMQTGCVRCLIKGIPCDPNNPECRLAMSDDWSVNRESMLDDLEQLTGENASLTLFRLDTKWRRRNWRERHSLNFFVNFSAPQMAGFFDSTFWQKMVIQASYHEPAILHAITAIGALHECIMQRAFADEKRKARAIEFALGQCNKAIFCLTQAKMPASNAIDLPENIPDSKVALITCVLFTCFEAMQGRCDSAVNHALQGRRLLQATGRPNVVTMSPPANDDVEQMRPIVERLEVQATALLDKGRRPEMDAAERTPPLPDLEHIHSLDHAHNTLHTALNSVMRFMQGFNPAMPKDSIAITMAEKYLRYGPWFSKWEAAFTTYLTETRESMSNMDLKRAMVLKANHLVGMMLASVDQSAGPAGYNSYEGEFRAIVDLAREVLASFSCPPLPTLTGGSSGTPYLSFSLWVTDPLWMAISRCRDPTIRQAAFTLLSQNPRQEGIWHAGPQLSSNRNVKRTEPMKEVEKSPPVSSIEEVSTSENNSSEYAYTAYVRPAVHVKSERPVILEHLVMEQAPALASQTAAHLQQQQYQQQQQSRYSEWYSNNTNAQTKSYNGSTPCGGYQSYMPINGTGNNT